MRTTKDQSVLALGAILQKRYRIIRKLGEGGMGYVYEAQHVFLECHVALKQTIYSDETGREWFIREAQLLRGLKHPSLPAVHDFFEEDGCYYLVMDFVPGPTLKDVLNIARVLPPNEVIRIAEHLLGILEYLHNQSPPIIHRDIKPANVKLSKEKVFLLDFGLSETTESDTHVPGRSLGYSSLEQIKNIQTDSRSDIYSLGATLYHLLTGVKPYSAQNRLELTIDPVLPIRELNPKVPESLAAVVHTAMAVEPEGRYANAAEMLRALGRTSTKPAFIVTNRARHVVKQLCLTLKVGIMPIFTWPRFILFILCGLLAAASTGVGISVWRHLRLSLDHKPQTQDIDRRVIRVNSEVETENELSEPSYRFTAVGDGNRTDGIPIAVHVRRKEDSEYLQTLVHPNMVVRPTDYQIQEGLQNILFPHYFHFEDINFDGSPDIRFIIPAGACCTDELVWLYNTATDSFDFNEQLTEIYQRHCDESIKPETKELTIRRCNNVDGSVYETYIFDEGNPVLVHKVNVY